MLAWLWPSGLVRGWIAKLTLGMVSCWWVMSVCVLGWLGHVMWVEFDEFEVFRGLSHG